MLAKCHSGAISGVDARAVEIEVDVSKGTNSFAIVGLPDQAVKEAKERVSKSISHSGFSLKGEFNVTVNLAPADVRKEGPIYDLPIAACFLKAVGRIKNETLHEYALVGELALSGEVRRMCHGILPIVMEMKRIGKRAVIVPMENAEEASIVKGIDVLPVATLRETVDFLNGELNIAPCYTDLMEKVFASRDLGDDFADVKGQHFVKRALEVAVAGGHNVLMIGSPGSGKTMLARRIPSILPPLSVEEALEVAKIHSVAGIAKSRGSFAFNRPYRAPHHTVSSVGLLGGGARVAPGEVSMAHRGVLFLDEFAEFPRNALEVLRQPLEDGHVEVSRAAAAHDFPSRFMLVAAMNPCPCGYYNDETHTCRCSHREIAKYQGRVSGPLLDRIDIQVEVAAVSMKDLAKMESGEPSANIRARVVKAREIQLERYRDLGSELTNSAVKSRDLQRTCKITPKAKDTLQGVLERLKLSARAYDKILRVARTIADLAGEEEIREEDVIGASSYRRMDETIDSFWF